MISSVSSWVLSIAGICILSVLVDLFLPQGTMSTHIKSVFNFIIIFVIVSPIPNLLKQNFDLSSFSFNSEIVLQEDYIYKLNQDKLIMLEEKIESSLTKEGLMNIDISVSADIFTTNMVIKYVFVDLSDLVIEKKDEHINIENKVIEVISLFIDIKKEKIIFNG